MRAAGNRTRALSWPRRILGHRGSDQCDRFAARTGLDIPARIRPANSVPKGKVVSPRPLAHAQDRCARLVGSNAATSDRKRGCSLLLVEWNRLSPYRFPLRESLKELDFDHQR